MRRGRRMRYILYFLFIIGLLFVITGVSNMVKQSEPHTPSASNGVIDLRHMNESSSSIVNLDGTWDFYWNTFTHSMENRDLNSLQQTSITVPSSWNEAATGDETISSLGYGTY